MLLITGIKSPQIFGSGYSLNQSMYSSNMKKTSKLGLSDEIFNIGEIAFD
jgi:hypothetical protein